jgi:hypothetical protein
MPGGYASGAPGYHSFLNIIKNYVGNVENFKMLGPK